MFGSTMGFRKPVFSHYAIFTSRATVNVPFYMQNKPKGLN